MYKNHLSIYVALFSMIFLQQSASATPKSVEEVVAEIAQLAVKKENLKKKQALEQIAVEKNKLKALGLEFCFSAELIAGGLKKDSPVDFWDQHEIVISALETVRRFPDDAKKLALENPEFCGFYLSFRNDNLYKDKSEKDFLRMSHWYTDLSRKNNIDYGRTVDLYKHLASLVLQHCSQKQNRDFLSEEIWFAVMDAIAKLAAFEKTTPDFDLLAVLDSLYPNEVSSIRKKDKILCMSEEEGVNRVKSRERWKLVKEDALWKTALDALAATLEKIQLYVDATSKKDEL